MRAHLDDAHAAAERLVQQAQREAEAAAASEVPPRGWGVPRPASAPTPLSELHTVVALLDAVRGAVPPELGRQLAESLRDLLLAVRALIDWYLERLGEADAGGGGAPVGDEPDVEDIPLD